MHGQHSGYRKLKAYQVAELVYDFTFRFCDRYRPKSDRHHDQMVQAARSGSQNIAEGSEDSATSNKLEMNLTNVARSSLDECRKAPEPPGPRRRNPRRLLRAPLPRPNPPPLRLVRSVLLHAQPIVNHPLRPMRRIGPHAVRW